MNNAWKSPLRTVLSAAYAIVLISVIIYGIAKSPPDFSLAQWWSNGARLPPPDLQPVFRDDLVGRFSNWFSPHFVALWNDLFAHDFVRYPVVAILLGGLAAAGAHLYKWLSGQKS